MTCIIKTNDWFHCYDERRMCSWVVIVMTKCHCHDELTLCLSWCVVNVMISVIVTMVMMSCHWDAAMLPNLGWFMRCHCLDYLSWWSWWVILSWWSWWLVIVMLLPDILFCRWVAPHLFVCVEVSVEEGKFGDQVSA